MSAFIRGSYWLAGESDCSTAILLNWTLPDPGRYLWGLAEVCLKLASEGGTQYCTQLAKAMGLVNPAWFEKLSDFGVLVA